MKKFAILAIAALVGATAFGQATWIGNSYINANGNWYTASGEAGDWTSGAWGDLGEIYSLTLGGQVQAYAGGEIWDNASGEWMHYYIDYDAQSEDPSKWVDLTLASGGQRGNNTLLQSGGYDFAGSVVDVSAFVDDGLTHNIAVYFGGVDGNYDSGNGNYIATFKVATPVPEPATMSLLGLGALAMVIRRKLRK